MTGRGVALGLTGLVASGLVHASALWALAAMVAPERVPDQPLPETRLDIAAQNVPRGDAAAVVPDAQALSQSDSEAKTVGQGTIAQSQATPLTPAAARLAAAVPTAQALASTAPAPEQAAVSAAPNPVAPVPMAAARVVAADPKPIALDKAALDAPRLPSAPPQSQSAAFAEPQTSAVAPSAPAATMAPAAPLPAERQTAALAWTGDADNTEPMAAASLAAIAAFTRPEDAAAGASEVRDGIAGILASVPCARLQTEFQPETGALVLRGHIPEDGLRAPVLAALRAQIGASIPLTDELLLLPRPQCAALAGIAGIGLPQSTEQLTNPRVIGEGGFARTYTYADGDRLELDLQAPDYPSFIYVDYFTADGMVLHLQPNQIVGLQFVAPKVALSVGRKVRDEPFLDLTIGPPFGQEIAVAFASSVPLYDRLRPLQEPASPYLDYLQERVAAKRAEDPAFKGEWVYFFISTVPG